MLWNASAVMAEMQTSTASVASRTCVSVLIVFCCFVTVVVKVFSFFSSAEMRCVGVAAEATPRETKDRKALR